MKYINLQAISLQWNIEHSPTNLGNFASKLQKTLINKSPITSKYITSKFVWQNRQKK